jgi:hypothetical protein
LETRVQLTHLSIIIDIDIVERRFAPPTQRDFDHLPQAEADGERKRHQDYDGNDLYQDFNHNKPDQPPTSEFARAWRLHKTLASNN